VVTGQSKQAAVQIDLNTGKVIQVVGSALNAEERDFKYYNVGEREGEKPTWLLLKQYDYLSMDTKNGAPAWTILYSQFSPSQDYSPEQFHQLQPFIPTGLSVPHLYYVKGNYLFSFDPSDDLKVKWQYKTSSPILQILRVTNGHIEDVPFNHFLEK